MTLLEKAHAAPRGNRRNYDAVVDAVEVLRAKGWGYQAIHQWLTEQGAVVHPNWITFASAMCRRIQNKKNKQKQ